MSGPGGIPTVDVREAHRRLSDGTAPALLVDVREPNEFAEVRAPDAVLVPMSRFLAELPRLPADRPLLFVCRSGNRSGAVTAYLARAGRTDVANVAGGMDAWEAAGLPVRHGPPDPGEGELPDPPR